MVTYFSLVSLAWMSTSGLSFEFATCILDSEEQQILGCVHGRWQEQKVGSKIHSGCQSLFVEHCLVISTHTLLVKPGHVAKFKVTEHGDVLHLGYEGVKYDYSCNNNTLYQNIFRSSS